MYVLYTASYAYIDFVVTRSAQIIIIKSFHMRNNNLNNSLEKLAKFALSHPKIIGNILRMSNYNDEPQVFTYSVQYPISGQNTQSFSSGTSFHQKRALIKALGEAIERYCLDTVDNDSLSTARIYDLHAPFLDPRSIPSFSKAQMAKNSYQQFLITPDSKFRWIEGYSYTEQTNVFIPAQVINPLKKSLLSGFLSPQVLPQIRRWKRLFIPVYVK